MQETTEKREEQALRSEVAERRRAVRSANRTILMILLAVAVTFLAGAFGVSALVVYGPF